MGNLFFSAAHPVTLLVKQGLSLHVLQNPINE